MLSYVVTGAIGELFLPPVVAAERAGELWRHTCFEVFVCDAQGGPYCEFNFAPSTQWAMYSFDGYRKGMRSIQEIDAPLIATRSLSGRHELKAELDLQNLAQLSGSDDWRLGLSAVMEEADERKSYWALAHPPGKPDFHHVAGFALKLSPPL